MADNHVLKMLAIEWYNSSISFSVSFPKFAEQHLGREVSREEEASALNLQMVGNAKPVEEIRAMNTQY